MQFSPLNARHNQALRGESEVSTLQHCDPSLSGDGGGRGETSDNSERNHQIYNLYLIGNMHLACYYLIVQTWSGLGLANTPWIPVMENWPRAGFILLEPLELVVSDGLWQNQKWALLIFMDLAKTLKTNKKKFWLIRKQFRPKNPCF